MAYGASVQPERGGRESKGKTNAEGEREAKPNTVSHRRGRTQPAGDAYITKKRHTHMNIERKTKGIERERERETQNINGTGDG